MKIGLLVFLFYFLLFRPEPAYAYLDPGTGSFMIQMIIAALLSASFAMKVYWKKAIGRISNIFKIKDKKQSK